MKRNFEISINKLQKKPFSSTIFCSWLHIKTMQLQINLNKILIKPFIFSNVPYNVSTKHIISTI